MDTPKLSLPEIAASQAQKHVTHNEALLMLDILVQASVLDRTHTAPPASPGDGNAYIVKATATGAWAGKEDQIAYCVDGGWRYLVPAEGWIVYDKGADTLLHYSGSAWQSARVALNVPSNAEAVLVTGAQTITGVKNISLSNATTLTTYMTFIPTDYGTGKPQLFVRKNGTATQWDVVLYDGTNNAGTLNFLVGTSLNWNGVQLVDLTTSQTLTNKTLSASTCVFAAAADLTKKLTFNCANITTATTRTVTVQDASGTMSLIDVAETLSGAKVFSLPPRLPTYTVATVPSASTYSRGLIYVSDGTSNKRLAISDGTNWRWPDGAIVS